MQLKGGMFHSVLNGAILDGKKYMVARVALSLAWVLMAVRTWLTSLSPQPCHDPPPPAWLLKTPSPL